LAKVYDNYRVQEQPGYATLLHRELSARFGMDRVFLASRSIHTGDDFAADVFRALRHCEVLLAVMGPGCLDHIGQSGTDWVRWELNKAFRSGVQVVPVLVEDAVLPDVTRLPEDIAAIAQCQYLRLRHYSIDTDIAKLVHELCRLVPGLDRRESAARASSPALFRLAAELDSPCRLAVVPSSISRVRTADIWVNSENTDMRMARHNDFSLSGVIRYWGAVRDDSGRVVEDLVADELDAVVGRHRPVAPGVAVVTGAGMLTKTHGVRHIIHVAAVQGQPGAGYRQIHDVGICVTNALAKAESLVADPAGGSVLFPMLGTGVAGAKILPTAVATVGAAVDYLLGHPDTRLRRICFLAYQNRELDALEETFGSMPVVPDRAAAPANR
jgi:hypothetical protein